MTLHDSLARFQSYMHIWHISATLHPGTATPHSPHTAAPAPPITLIRACGPVRRYTGVANPIARIGQGVGTALDMEHVPLFADRVGMPTCNCQACMYRFVVPFCRDCLTFSLSRSAASAHLQLTEVVAGARGLWLLETVKVSRKGVASKSGLISMSHIDNAQDPQGGRVGTKTRAGARNDAARACDERAGASTQPPVPVGHFQVTEQA